MSEHRNGNADPAAKPEAPEAEDPVQDAPEESDVEVEAQPDHGDDDSLESVAEKLQPAEGDTQEQATDKKAMLKMVNRALMKAANARKSMQSDPAQAQKAAALDFILKAPNTAEAIAQLKGAFGGQQGGELPDVSTREKALREWFGNDEGFDKMMELMELHADSRLRPEYRQGLQAVSHLAERTVESDWDKLAAQHDGAAEEFKDETFKIARQYGFPLTKALLLASDGALVTRKKAVSDKTRQQKSLTTPTQGAASGAYSKPKPKAGGSTHEDRVRSFAQGVRKSGLELPWNRFGKA